MRAAQKAKTAGCNGSVIQRRKTLVARPIRAKLSKAMLLLALKYLNVLPCFLDYLIYINYEKITKIS